MAKHNNAKNPHVKHKHVPAIVQPTEGTMVLVSTFLMYTGVHSKTTKADCKMFVLTRYL